MNRADFQQLAKLRIKEAKILLDAGCYEGAYYLVGYAVECALKACIAKQTKRYDFPPDRETIQRIYVHDLTELLKRSGLKSAHDNDLEVNKDFGSNWNVVKDWTEQSRYKRLSEKAYRRRLGGIRRRDVEHGGQAICRRDGGGTPTLPTFQTVSKTKIAEVTARELYFAVTDKKSGVLPWLKKYW